jgi:hypothetical protein
VCGNRVVYLFAFLIPCIRRCERTQMDFVLFSVCRINWPRTTRCAGYIHYCWTGALGSGAIVIF